MKTSLIIQCIDTFGFIPAEDKLRFYADGKRFYPVRKSGGFYVTTMEMPTGFTLSVRSDIYYDRECRASPEMEMIRADLIRRSPPPRKSSVWFNIEAYGRAALEYGYFYIGKPVKAGDERITAENQYRFCLEGRVFLLLDTCSGAEEFIMLEKAENALMTDYLTSSITNDYSAEHSVMLPAFELYVKANIPLEKPSVGEAALRLYDENGKNAVRVRIDGE